MPERDGEAGATTAFRAEPLMPMSDHRAQLQGLEREAVRSDRKAEATARELTEERPLLAGSERSADDGRPFESAALRPTKESAASPEAPDRPATDSRRNRDRSIAEPLLRPDGNAAASKDARPESASARGAAQRREPDEIQINIGRIEVTAVPAPVPAAAPRARRSASSLDDYLRGRDGGKR